MSDVYINVSYNENKSHMEVAGSCKVARASHCGMKWTRMGRDSLK